uniref:Uncharacterized protein n=1 Tax=Arundo donax TaxID=35708 RepID=A0A0A9GE42_ARUDO
MISPRMASGRPLMRSTPPPSPPPAPGSGGSGLLLLLSVVVGWGLGASTAAVASGGVLSVSSASDLLFLAVGPGGSISMAGGGGLLRVCLVSGDRVGWDGAIHVFAVFASASKRDEAKRKLTI